MRVFAILILGVIPAIAQQNFYPFTIDQDRLSGAPDFSFLNHPLRAADRIFVRDGHFYRVGADLAPGTADDARVRMFGVNFAFGANFPEAADAPRIARRLRRLGVNLVRCHHMDSSPDRDPSNANSLLTTGPYPTLNPVAVERLRRFLDALTAEGIYINLNLHVGYQFRPDVDHVPAVEGVPFPKQSKPLHIFYPRMVELELEYTRKVIDALKLKGDPVLAMVEIDNETSLLEAFQKGNLERDVTGAYRAELEKQWNEYKPGAGSLVSFKEVATDPRGNDFLLFLADRDRHYMRQMLGAVREKTDRLVPVTGTQMGYGGLLNLDSQADLDYQDNHFYIDHYNFPHKPWDAHDWRIRDASAVGTGLTAYLNMAAAREAGRPYTVSEFNQPWPNRHAAEIDPTFAAFAAFQDWDAVIHFAYSHSRHWESTAPNGFDVNGDWTKYPGIGQAAWLFRTGAIQPGTIPVRVAVTRQMQLEAGRKRAPNVAQYLAGTGFDPAVALVHRVGLAKGAAAKSAPAVTAPYTSDTGEIEYDPARKIYRIEAPQAAGVFGFLGPDKVTAGAIDVQLGEAEGGFACILVTALDGRTIAQSARLLISTPGYTIGKDQRFVLYPGAKDWWTLDPPERAAKGQVLMSRVESTVTLRTSARNITVYPLEGAGARLEALGAGAVKKANGAFEIHLQGDGQQFAPWYEIVTEH